MQLNIAGLDRRPRQGGTLIGGLVLILAGIIVFQVSGYFFKDMEKTLQWPSVPGVISVSEIIESRGRNSEGHEVTKYRANVSALYEVEGLQQRSDSITPIPMTTSNSRRVIKKDIELYPVGAEVQVFYDPDDPSYGILEPGAPRAVKLLKILPWLSMGAGILLILKRLLKFLGMK